MMPKNSSTAIAIDPKTVFSSIIDTCSKLQEFNFTPNQPTAAIQHSCLIEKTNRQSHCANEKNQYCPKANASAVIICFKPPIRARYFLIQRQTIKTLGKNRERAAEFPQNQLVGHLFPLSQMQT
jgi:hypothetical protein